MQVIDGLLVDREEAASWLPYSGAMLAMVARLASGISSSPATEELDELADDAVLAQHLRDTRRTRSVAVAPSASFPVSRNPTTSGISM